MDVGRENYFIELGLMSSIENPDRKAIDEAISAWDKKWAASNREEAPAKRELSKEFKRMMSDPELFRQELEQAQLIKKEQGEYIKESFSDLYAQGVTELSDEMLKSYVNDFAQYGYDKETIRKMFEDWDGPSDVTVPEIITENDIKSITRSFRNMGKVNATLYSFLDMPDDSSCEELYTKAEEEERKSRNNVNANSYYNDMQNLYTICMRLFSDEGSKATYDNYLRLTEHQDLNDRIDRVASISENNEIKEATAYGFIDDAINKYSLSSTEAYDYVATYSAWKGYKLEGVDRNSTLRRYQSSQPQPQPQPQPVPVQDELQHEREKRAQEKEELHKSLMVGRKAVEKILPIDRELDSLEADKNKDNSTAVGCAVWISYALVALGVGAAVFAIIIVLSGSLEKPGPNAMSGNILTYQSNLHLFIGLIVFTVFALIVGISGGRYCKKGKDKKIAENKANRQAQINALKLEKHQIFEEFSKELEILPERYRYNLNSYIKGIKFLDEGSAESIDDIVRMLDEGM